ncbi:probable cytochrome P450 CYP44 [Physella acuta]|uniref:probable cytochrome P450 CYP44 n=1 Tax=Physella acuta TaxID=109671 RepID=UPI0027DD8C85|nr:probable cytochrome P450 CYP44 [Physella acuta]
MAALNRWIKAALGTQCRQHWMSTVSVDTRSEQVNARPFREIPGPRGIYLWPYIGIMLHYKPFSPYTADTTYLLHREMHRKYGPIFKYRVDKFIVQTSSPEDMETIFRNEGKFPYRPPAELDLVYAKRTGYKQTLASLNGEEWYKVRTPANKRLMKADSAHHYLAPQNQVADEFVHILSTQEMDGEEMQDYFFRFAAESIGIVCFNARLGFLSKSGSEDETSVEFLKATKAIFDVLLHAYTGASILHKWFRNKTYRDYERACNIIKKNSAQHILRAKKAVEDKQRAGTLDPEEPNFLLSLTSENIMDERYICSITEVLYITGTDSTARNLQVLFYNLAKNPDKQETLRREVLSVVGPDKPVDAQALSKMPYLKACLNESFRLYFPTPTGVMRILPTDVVLSGYKVPAGTSLTLSNPEACRHVSGNPDKFIPERWIRTESGKRHDDIHSMVVLPFGFGPRNCIGRRFAVQEIYLAASKVLQKLKIDVDDSSRDTEFVYKLFVHPTTPIKFKFTKISTFN